MRMNKEVCQICMRGVGHSWAGDDDVRWNRCEVYCKPCSVTNLGDIWHRSCRIDRFPPGWCRYALEHIVTFKPSLWERVWNCLGRRLW